MHRTIVVGAGHGHPLRDALALGIVLARPRGAQVVLARVWLMPVEVPPDPELEELRQEAPHDVPVSVVEVHAESVTEGLHGVVEEHGAELLVLGASHLSHAGRIAGGDLSLQALHDAPCAIAVAPHGYAARATHAPRRIGIAWDGGPQAGEALEWAVQLGERAAAELRILHVVEDRDADADDAMRVAEIRAAAAARTPTAAEMTHGDPAPQLLRSAKDVDLLVLGSRSRSPLGRMLLGSVSAKVLEQAECPVVVLPKGVRAPVETAI